LSHNPLYVTTPIYYVNDEPHIGHAYTSLAADILSRFTRLDGRPVKFLTGTDEHGLKIERSAEKSGKSCLDFVTEISQRFRNLSDLMNFTQDDFIRTTEPRHKVAAQKMWETLESNGYIYESTYSGWYSVRDEAYYTEAELIDGKAPTGAPVEWVEEPSFFFKLSAFEEPLLKYYDDNPDFIQPKSRRNEVISFVKSGLRDLSISRSTFKWGIPVPNHPGHVMYVWIEALTNYLTSLGFPDMESAEFKQFWPHSVHLVGKDILRFHAIYWPAFLMAAKISLPKRIFAHGWWTNEGEKISKSLGNVIKPDELVETYGLDPVRYFLIREIPFGSDGDFSRLAITHRCNADLANDLGNLVQRVLSFVYKHCDGKIPAPGDLQEQDREILTKGKTILEEMREYADEQKLNKMCESLWTLIGDANKYVDSQEPWALRKTDTDRMHTVLYVLAEVIRHIALLVQPITPDAACKILDQLTCPMDQRNFDALEKFPLQSHVEIPKPVGIFPRIEVVNK